MIYFLAYDVGAVFTLVRPLWTPTSHGWAWLGLFNTTLGQRVGDNRR